MPNQKNIDVVEKLRKRVAKAKSIVLADISGLDANKTNELRAKMTENEAEVSLSKNSLLEIALKEKHDTTNIEKHLKGSTIAIFSYQDTVATIKAIFEVAKKFELVKVKAAIIDGMYTTGEDVEKISKLPSREQLIAQVLGTMKSPLSGFVNVLGGTQRKLVYALSAVAKKKGV